MIEEGLTPSFSSFTMLIEISVTFLLNIVKASFKFSDNAFLIGMYEDIKGILIPEIMLKYTVLENSVKEVFNPEYLKRKIERIIFII